MEFRFTSGDKIETVRIERDGNAYQAHIGDKSYRVEVLRSASGEWTLALGDQIIEGFTAHAGDQLYVALNGNSFVLTRAEPGRIKRAAVRDEGRLSAPMPGRVTQVMVREDENVVRGQTLLLLEAMKMEIRISAPRDSVVRKLLCSTGQIVARGQKLVELF